MALTDAQWQARVLAELGQVSDLASEGTPLAAFVAESWTVHAGAAARPRLRFLYCLRDALRYLLGQNWSEAVDVTAGTTTQKLNQVQQNLKDLLEATLEEIKTLLGSDAPEVGMMSAVTPITTPAGYADPNGRYYRGDPTKRNPWTR